MGGGKGRERKILQQGRNCEGKRRKAARWKNEKAIEAQDDNTVRQS